MNVVLQRWEAINSRGHSVGGVVGGQVSPEKFARVKFKAGYRQLTMTRNGEVVAAIEQSVETGKRTWWGEK